MSLPTEAVTLAGSGLVFINSYGANVTDAYRGAALAAENFLQSHFTNSLTVSVTFDFQSLGATFSAQNNFSDTAVSFSAFAAALRSHATTADDFLAVNGLPAFDPSNGVGFAIPNSEARALGLAVQSNSVDDHVTLNSDLLFTFGQDAVGAIEHEITEGVFGRIASLGFDGRWNGLDLFRFTAFGQRDFTGGSDGQQTFFGIDGNHVSNLAFHNSINAAGVNDGFDLGDWDHTRGDSFGPGGPNSPGNISAVDLQVVDVLGWNPTNAAAPFIPPPDDFASSLTDTAHPFGQLAVGSSVTGALQQAGDHDWFAVQLQAGATYTINLTGQRGAGGTLADPFLKLHDAFGNVLASNDDIVDGTNPDSQIVFTAPTTGAFYVDAGAFVDGYAGSYRVSITQTAGAVAGGTPGQVLFGAAGGDTVQAGAGNDTMAGGPGADIFHSSQDAGIDKVLDFNLAEGDRVQLDPGTTFTVHQVGADTWVDMGNGNELILVGVNMATLTGNWIFEG